MANDSVVGRNRLKGNTLEQHVEDALDAGGLNYEPNKLYGVDPAKGPIQSRPDFVLTDADGAPMAVIECKSKEAPADGSGVVESVREGNQAAVAIGLGQDFGTNTTVYIGDVGDRVKGAFGHVIDHDQGLEQGLAEYAGVRAAEPGANVLLHSADPEAVVPIAEAIADANGFDRLRPDADPALASDSADGFAIDLPMEPPAPIWPAPPEASPGGAVMPGGLPYG